MKYFYSEVSETHVSLLLLALISTMYGVVAGASDAVVRHELFGEPTLASNILNVRQRAINLPDDDAYQWLSMWVLPCESRNTLRLGGVFKPPHPALSSEDTRSREESLVSPAYDLVDTAERTGRLDELRNRIARIQTSSDDQKRAKLALQFLVEAARRDRESAKIAVDELLTLSANDKRLNYEFKWPQLLAAFRGIRNPLTRDITSELCTHLSGQVLEWRSSGNVVWDHQVASLHGLQRSLKMDMPSPVAMNLSEESLWIPGSVHTAKSRGTGMPAARWHRNGSFAEKVSPYNIDFLYYGIPLTGDYNIECEATTGGVHNTGLMFGGYFFALRNRETFDLGTIRAPQQIKLEKPLTHVERWGRLRLRVRGRTCTTWFNGKQINERQLSEKYDPWLAIYSFGRHQSSVRNLRINGKPTVPMEVGMATEEQLVGWVPYYQERVGTGDDQAHWRFNDGPSGPGIVGDRFETPEGANQESLLLYHRPMDRYSEVEYEFYFEPDKTLVHPTLDRLTFLLEPDGVKIHWVTDGRYDSGKTDPGNRSPVLSSHRGVDEIPLLPSMWNRLKLRIHDETVQVILNDVVVCERPLGSDNQRVFGLFHFADQTDVRVRNIVMRGSWAESVPSVFEQELADDEAFPEQHFSELPAVFSHDFVEAPIAQQYFDYSRSANGRLTFSGKGIHASVTTQGKWTGQIITPHFMAHGDFDIEIAYDQLKTLGDDQAGIMLCAQLDNEQRHLFRIMRQHGTRQREQVVASNSLVRPDGKRSYESSLPSISEARSGRLRLARRGTTLYSLFADGDSPGFHITSKQTVSDVDTAMRGFLFQALCNGTSSVEVLWKSLTIRSEKLTWHQPPTAKRQWKLLVMNEDGSDLKTVTARPDGYRSLGSAEWSFDGKQIMYDTYRSSLGDSRCKLINADGTMPVDRGLGSMPGLSPDGTKIVFTQSGRGVQMMDADGSNRVEIDRSGWSAQWAPDGKSLAWGQRGNIVVMNLATEQRTPILVGPQATMFSSTYWNPGWSHDSKSVAFKARNRRTGGEDVVVADVDSSDGFQILVASSTGVHPDFTFSPDNRRVMFPMNSKTDGVPRLHTVDRDNPGPPQQLPGQPSNWKIFSCDWHPSGKIALVGEEIPQPVDWATVMETRNSSD